MHASDDTVAIAADYYSKHGFINASSVSCFDHRCFAVSRRLQCSCRRAAGDREESGVGCYGGGGQSTPSWATTGAGGVVSETGGVIGEEVRVYSMVVRCIRSRQFRDRLNLVEMVDGMDLLMECLPAMTSCLGCFDGRMMLEKKMLGAAAAVIDSWIKAIGLGHKNRLMEASSQATEGMESSLLAAVIDGWLRPHRIWDRLDVAYKMGGLDYPTGCPSMVGLPEMKPTVAATIGMVETSPLLDEDC
ncbi:hypothetical protein ACLOJK_028725 [Asimina triloba]